LSNWNGEIIKYLNSIGNQIISPNDITIQQLASYYGHTGGKGNLGKTRTEEHRANNSAGQLGKKRVKPNDDEWLANLSKVKTFIDDEARHPRQKSSDAGERKLASWIAQSKRNNERKQLMKRDITSVFVAVKPGPITKPQDDEWHDMLERVMMFIATEGRKPRDRSSDTDEKKLAYWIKLHKQKERGTKSERE
jgi:hypothetical protein